MVTIKGPSAAALATSWRELLARYERALAAAQAFDAPPLLAVEAELRRRLQLTPEREQGAVCAAVRGIEVRVLGWDRPTRSSDEAAPELRSLGFCELAISESRRLQE